jgi:hypothetical protein
MSKTINTTAYDTFSNEKDVAVLRDFTSNLKSLAYKRIAPKRVKDFPGMEKTELKHTLLDASGVVQGIVSISTSIRADLSAATRQDLILTARGALADTSWADLVNDQRLPLTV